MTAVGAALASAGPNALGVYLVVKGFKPSPITAGMQPDARP